MMVDLVAKCRIPMLALLLSMVPGTLTVSASVSTISNSGFFNIWRFKSNES